MTAATVRADIGGSHLRRNVPRDGADVDEQDVVGLWTTTPP
jgi:hypothetical protein